MKKSKKNTIIVVTIIALITAAVFINNIPTFSLESRGMASFEGRWINVFYEKERAAAEDVFKYADSETAEIAGKLGFSKKEDINVYIYDEQSTMQRKKYGFIVSLLNLDWYIGDNIGTDVILTSPANPGKEHSYEDVVNASTHEITHAYISVLNPDISLWLTEGMALYLTNGEPLTKEVFDAVPVPSFRQINTSNPITFSNSGGYTYAHTYIDYLEKEYGWDKVIELIKTEDYETLFGKTAEDIYDDWVLWLNEVNDSRK